MWNLTFRWSLQLSKALFEVKWYVEDLRLLSVSFCPWFWVLQLYLGSVSPKCPDAPNTLKQVKLPSTGFYTWVMLQLMWNVGFNTFYEFLYIQSPWFGVFGPNFPDLLQCPKYTKTGINQPSDSLYIWVRFHLMWNAEFNFLDNFLCIGFHDLGCLGSVCPTCPNSLILFVLLFL